MDRKLTYKLELSTEKFAAAVKKTVKKMQDSFAVAGRAMKKELGAGMKAIAPDVSSYTAAKDATQRAGRLSSDIGKMSPTSIFDSTPQAAFSSSKSRKVYDDLLKTLKKVRDMSRVTSESRLKEIKKNREELSKAVETAKKKIKELQRTADDLDDGIFEGAANELDKLSRNVSALETSVKQTMRGQYEMLQDELSEMKLEAPVGLVLDNESGRLLDEMRKSVEDLANTKVSQKSGLSGLFDVSDKIEEAQIKLLKLKDELSNIHPEFDFSEFGEKLDDMLFRAKERAASLETAVDQSSSPFSLQHIRGNMRGAMKTVKGGVSQFFTDVKGTNTVAGMADAFVGLGKSGFSALTKLVNPYMQVIALGTAAFLGLKKLCEQYEELEKAALRAKFAFSTGGAAAGASAGDYEKMARQMAAGGAVSSTQIMEGVGSLRMSARSIDNKTLEKLTKMAPDIAAFTGKSEDQAILDVGRVLDATSASYEELRDIGVDVNKQELEMINILKEQGRQEEANAIIMEKLGKATEGAADVVAGTMAGQWKRFKGMMSEMMVDIGEAVAPILKVVMAVVNPIMQIVKHLVKHILVWLKPIMVVFNGITRQINAFTKGAGGGFKKLSESWMKLKEALLDNPLVTMLQKLGEVIWSGIGKAIGRVAEKVAKILDGITSIIESIKSSLSWVAWLFGMKSKDDKKKDKKKEKWIDPRIEFSAGFEGLSSMNQRIQSSLISKNSPQAQMVNLLTAIKDGVDYIKANGRESLAATQENVRATKNLNVGAGY